MIRASLLLVAGLWAGACLPEAEPPSGTRLFAVRGISAVSFSRGQSAGAHLVFTRLAPPAPRTDPAVYEGGPADQPLRDLFAVPRAGGGARPLVRGLAPWASEVLWDERGRGYAQHDGDFGSSVRVDDFGLTAALAQFDPAGGEPVTLGRVHGAWISPGGTRLHYATPSGTVVRELDGRERRLEGNHQGLRFVGEDLFLLEARTLSVLGRDDERPVPLVQNAMSWLSAVGPSGEVVITAQRPASVVDVEVVLVRPGVRPPTIESIAVGLIAQMMLSPDGRRVAFVERLATPTMSRLRVVELGDRRERMAELPLTKTPEVRGSPPYRPPTDGLDPRLAGVEVQFRPASDEVWFQVGAELRILRGDGSVEVVKDRRWAWPRVARRGDERREQLRTDKYYGNYPAEALGSVFTSDGRRWVYTDGDDGNVLLGDADAPAAPGTVLARQRDFRQLVEGAPGRLFLQASLLSGTRVDLEVVDWARSERRVLVRGATAAVIGADRVLALTRSLGNGGLVPSDLVLVDIATAEERRIARNVTELAVPAACASCDGTAPGVPVAFVINARVPFSQDGLWIVELP